MDKNSMLFWYPLIKNLPIIPQPETIIVEVDPKFAYDVIDGKGMYPEMGRFVQTIGKLGLPVFIRTDQMSGKHDWKKTCYFDASLTPSHTGLLGHIYRLTEATLGCDVVGKSVNAFVFRKYIPMDSKYTAFWGEMPVNPERRYFVENGFLVCHHPYWTKDAIQRPSVENWEELSEEMNKETEEEIALLSRYARLVSNSIEGFWSVDFCKAKDGRWILIDMALGENSWHPEDCPYNRTKKIDYLQHFAKKTETK